jgi:hypothetical protein
MVDRFSVIEASFGEYDPGRLKQTKKYYIKEE